MKKFLIPAAILIVLGLATILLVVFPLVFTPRFITANLSDEPIFLTVEWRDQSMSVGNIEPGQQLEFRLNDEAPLTFVARFPGGVRVASMPVPFRRGTVIHARVTSSGIEVAGGKGT